MTVFDDYFAAADELFAEVFGAAGSIVRGSSQTSGVTLQMIVRGQPIEGDLPTKLHIADWLVAAADYKVGGVAVTPRDGDRLKVEIGGVTYVWELLPLDARPSYEWGDAQRQNWLLHTKLAGTE